jgi:predicted protein tyrosine phosphatase
MNPFQNRLFVCGADEREKYRTVSHWVTVANPGAPGSAGFHGKHLQLWFGDVASEADARQWKTSAPTIGDVQQTLEFFREAWATEHSRILVTCDYGASRSPALAYLCIADQLGPGREDEALRWMLEIRPDAVPNGFVVQLGDTLLKRRGALLGPLKELYAKINAELFPNSQKR